VLDNIGADEDYCYLNFNGNDEDCQINLDFGLDFCIADEVLNERGCVRTDLHLDSLLSTLSLSIFDSDFAYMVLNLFVAVSV